SLSATHAARSRHAAGRSCAEAIEARGGRLMPPCRALLALGFFVAALSVATAAAASAQDIACDRGDLEVATVEFVGNQAFTDAQLAIGIVTTPSSWARRVFRKIGTSRCLDTLEVRRDPIRLLYFYSQRGFINTRV